MGTYCNMGIRNISPISEYLRYSDIGEIIHGLKFCAQRVNVKIKYLQITCICILLSENHGKQKELAAFIATMYSKGDDNIQPIY